MTPRFTSPQGLLCKRIFQQGMVDTDSPPRVAGGLDDPIAVGDARGQRLFDKYVTTVCQGIQGELRYGFPVA